MTHEELNKNYDMWMRRNRNLRIVAFNETEPISRRYKALRLSDIMIERLLKLNNELIQSLTYPEPSLTTGGAIN